MKKILFNKKLIIFIIFFVFPTNLLALNIATINISYILEKSTSYNNFLAEFINYNDVIKHNIGLRLQSRLTKEQAKFVARCNSVHRDISLNF